MTIDDRKENFKKEVFEVGGLLYSKRMLDEFFEWWSEKNRATGKAQKMKFEREATWETSKRLSYWARRTNGHNPYLSSLEKTIEMKKREFASMLKPFLDLYGPDMLNDFYRHWSQPENKARPEYLRWEQEAYWDLPQRLKQWQSRNEAINRVKRF